MAKKKAEPRIEVKEYLPDRLFNMDYNTLDEIITKLLDIKNANPIAVVRFEEHLNWDDAHDGYKFYLMREETDEEYRVRTEKEVVQREKAVKQAKLQIAVLKNQYPELF